MSDALVVISPKTLTEAKDLAQTLSAARTLPEALAKSPADILAIVMTGAELGLAPMASLRGIHIIKGKPTLSADVMGAIVKGRRDVCTYLRLVESTNLRAEYETQRVGEPQPTKLAFTIEDARNAGLIGDNWKKFPSAMLRARALSAICRAVYPDLILGVYDPDELAAESITLDRGAQTPEPTKGARLKAQIRAALADDKVVDAPAPAPQKASTPYTECVALGQSHGLDEKKTCAALLLATGRQMKKKADVTAADLAALEKHLDSQNGSPPPVSDEEAAEIAARERQP